MTYNGCCHNGFDPQSFGFFFCRFTTASNPPARYGWKALLVPPIQKKSFRDGLVKPLSPISDSRRKKGTSPSSTNSFLMNPVSSTSSVSTAVSAIAGDSLPVSKCGIGSYPESRRLRRRVSNILCRCREYAAQNVTIL